MAGGRAELDVRRGGGAEALALRSRPSSRRESRRPGGADCSPGVGGREPRLWAVVRAEGKKSGGGEQEERGRDAEAGKGPAEPGRAAPAVTGDRPPCLGPPRV